MKTNFRKVYMRRFIFRCAVLLISILLAVFVPSQFELMQGFGFFSKPSFFHLMWVFWIFDMVMQLTPTANYWPLGSRKFFANCFRQVKKNINIANLKRFVKKANRSVILIGIVWTALILLIGAGYFAGLYPRRVLLVISAAFYVCDLICVLFWCPFRVWFMKNRCCTTCRIFNWDHIMMFSPLIFVPGFFTWSLVLLAFAVFLVWEITFAQHPERFWEGANDKLKCSNCTDRLCGNRLCDGRAGACSQAE